MRYKKLMKSILSELAQYKNDIDNLSAAYQAEVEKREEEFKEMDGKYTSEFISESRQHWKPKKDYAKAINAARKKHRRNAFAYLAQVKEEMDAYFQVPVGSGFSTTVTAIKALGLTLSDREFEVLQGAAGGFWGLRLLNELAISRTKTGRETELENGEVRRKEKETKIPYGGVELPSIEGAHNALREVESAINLAFSGYCGMNYELADIVFPSKKAAEETNARIEAAYGAKVQHPARDSMDIHKMANSVRCFDENHSAYATLSETMGSLMATMPESKKKTTLTDSDKALIDALIDPSYPSLAQGKAVKIAGLDERLGDLLKLDERYKIAVTEALGSE